MPELTRTPSAEVQALAQDGGATDTDTCRICRCEGTSAEPLFYPCKCSGSIKFVHQECLMEWLSHSQKKYCELCKTPFRFTKLYQPHAPSSVPFSLFLRHLAIHALKTLVLWSRFALVCFVWLCWLPWSMRAIWRFLFWLGDGRWYVWTGPASPGLNALATSERQSAEASIISTTMTLPPRASGATDDTSKININVGMFLSNLALTLGNYATFGIFSAGPVMMQPNESYTNLSKAMSTGKHGSFLSDVSVLNNLTPSQTFNGLLIDTIEGQIITLAIVVAFILVFLIREWVVQAPQRGGVLDDIPVPPQPALREAPIQGDIQELYDEGPTPELEPIARPAIPLRNPDRLEIESENLNRANSSEATAESRQEQQLEAPDANLQNNDVYRRDIERLLQESFPEPISQDLFDLDFLKMSRDEDTAQASSEGAEEMISAASISRNIPGSGEGKSIDMIDEDEREASFVPEPLRYRRPAAMERNNVGRVTEVQRRLYELGSLQATLEAESSSGHEHRLSRNLSLDDFGAEKGKKRELVVQKGEEEFISFEGPSSSISEDLHPADSGMPATQLSPDTYQTTTSFWPDSLDAAMERPLTPHFSYGVTAGTSDAQPSNQHHDEWSSFEDLGTGQSQSSQHTQFSTVADRAPAGLQSQPARREDSPPRLPEDNAQPVQSFWERAQNWMWGEIAPGAALPDENDEHVVEDIDAEPPFVPVPPAEEDLDIPEVELDPPAEDDNDDWEDINDADPVDDGDDFDGVMELIGMRGPLAGLFQNGLFAAVIISATVSGGIWFPYIWGKFVIILVAHPVTIFFRIPFRWLSFVADFAADLVLMLLGVATYWATRSMQLVFSLASPIAPQLQNAAHSQTVTNYSRTLASGGYNRMSDMLDGSSFYISQADFPAFSILSHEALQSIKETLAAFLANIFNTLIKYASIDWTWVFKPSFSGIWSSVAAITISAIELISTFFKGIQNFNLKALKVSIEVPARTEPVDASLMYWNGSDRTIAILAGYAFFTLIGALYLKKKTPFSSSTQGQSVEKIVREILEQSGGVLKVIFIIGLEMIVFPLYCGILLDFALLPLFPGASVVSRMEFTRNSPVTSLFVHWFAGTCYMFHFALFVTMCRKIMRKGVLYFIRDPDDPTFHPVRDVLERSIATQLRKIGFSALVYGALVIVCLGSVVWSIYYAFKTILPIHWSSNEPVLEFPVDLLFYTFLVPLTAELFDPGEKLHKIYTWWFRRSARLLRLTWFFFGERKVDEEGYHLTKAWADYFSGKKGDITKPVIDSDSRLRWEKTEPNIKALFIHDGKYVRAPASDQVRIPKGSQVFVEVNENNERIDGQEDKDDGLHGRKSEKFAQVYVPPHLRLRISAFIAALWAFTAIAGVSATILPLLLGRKIFATFIAPQNRMNDVYAFSIGIYIFGGLVLLVEKSKSVWQRLQTFATQQESLLAKTWAYSKRAFSIVYTYSAFIVLLPALFALLMEFFFIIPIHTYFSPGARHVIHFVQDWTLGVLYVKMAGRFILWYRNSRPAEALQAIVRDGWLKPDAWTATRSFILPASVVMLAALAVPLPLGWLANTLIFRNDSIEKQNQIYRYSYPAVLALALLGIVLHFVTRLYNGWKRMIRDELYLIGERLHNFADKKSSQHSTGVKQR